MFGNIEILEIEPFLTEEQLEPLRSQLLKPEHGCVVQKSVVICCEGKMKALYLKGDQHRAISQLSYLAALHGLKLMKMNAASHSRRKSVKQKVVGADLMNGWMGGRKPPWEDVFRAGNRDNFIPGLYLKPLYDDFERAMKRYLPEYYAFHMEQAMKLVRPKSDRLKTLHKVENYCVRKGLEQWDEQTKHYHVPGTTAFSTITLNKNILFGGHDDGRNVSGTLSCLTALGEFLGGSLCFPRLGIAFDLQPYDLLIADTNTEYHGTLGGVIGERYSIVAYLHKSLAPKQ